MNGQTRSVKVKKTSHIFRRREYTRGILDIAKGLGLALIV
jgi:hypothetical protein